MWISVYIFSVLMDKKSKWRLPTAVGQPSQGVEKVVVVAMATDVAVTAVGTVEVVDGTVVLAKTAEVVEDTAEIEKEDTGKSTKLYN